MKTIILFLLCFATSLQAGLQSSYESTVANLSTPNAHYVGSSSAIRGQAPRSKKEFVELKELGIATVIIFKNQTKTEVDREIDILNELGMNYVHLDFPWKDVTDFTPVCENAKSALKILKGSNDIGQMTFFHCTVGEDRTGTLAGLFLQVIGEERDVGVIYQNEMCAKGYADGNKKKHFSVARKVKESLNPVFLKMSYLLKKSDYDVDGINCQHDFERDREFKTSFYARDRDFSCY